jgi:hypothetical protein
MLALVRLVASPPVIVCAVRSVFLAYRDRFRWMWFAVREVPVEFGGLAVLGTANTQCSGAQHDFWPSPLRLANKFVQIGGSRNLHKLG